MKNYTTIALILLVNIVSAQRGFHIGLSGAFNSTWIVNQNNYYNLTPMNNRIVQTSEMDYRATWGYSTGVNLGYNFKQSWGIQMDLLYTSAGQKYQDNFDGPATLFDTTMIPVIDTFFPRGDNNIKVTRNVRLGYVQIPIMVKYITKEGNRAKFYMLFGPQIGIKVLNKEDMTFQDIPFTPVAPYEKSKKFKAIDFGFALRLGTEIYATDHLFFDLGLALYAGAIDINGKVLKDLGWYSQNDVKYQRSHNFNAGLMFGVHYLIGKYRVLY